MAVQVVPGLIIGLREGIEAALVIAIILAYLTKIDQKPLRRYVYLGTLAAVVASVAVAGLWALAWGSFGGTGEELFEGFAAILAVIVLTTMILWMMKAAKDIKKHVERRIDVLVDKRQVFGLTALAFVAVFREGVETVLFMAGLAGNVTTADLVVGIGIGLAAAAFLGIGIMGAAWKINLKRFFQVTGVLLVIIAAGLFSFGVHELQEAYGWGLDGEVYNAQAVLPDKLPSDGTAPSAAQTTGALLRGLVGYNDNPTVLEAVAYVGYWIFTLLLYWGVKTGKIEVVSRPFRQLWAMIRPPAPSQPA